LSRPETCTSLALVFAWLVHFYTALGVALAFGALWLIVQGSIRQAFWLMAMAVAIDATDGTLARTARVKERIHWFDGDRLEDIVDYLNYVLVPAFLLVRAQLLPSDHSLWLAMLPLLASAYGFCHKEAKTSDHYFLGFPSYWNIVVFYFYVLQTPPWLNALVLVLCSGLVFVPIRYIYPSRSPVHRSLVNTLGILWAFLVLLIVYFLPQPRPLLVVLSLSFPAYYISLSIWLEFQKWQRGEA
jgi:phosphatidylcholine synthase